MGNFIDIIKSKQNQPNTKLKENKLLNQSQAKLREFHGSFKSVCDTFSIDFYEFEQIFQASESLFNQWDTDQNGLIDALELFSGLIIYSDAKFDEKIRFLFDLFDFNELNSLSLVDLEFMLNSCCNATFKILGYSDIINEEEVCQFLGMYYNDDSRINISQMLKWCYKNVQIEEFFSAISKDIPKTKKQEQGRQEVRTCYEQKIQNELQGIEDDKLIELKSSGEVMNSRVFQNKLDWISQLTTKIQKTPNVQKDHNKDISVKMNWVYGFRCNDVKKSILYVEEQQKLIYFTACICVIYKRDINEQYHYQLHKQEVISIGLSQNRQMVASGELAQSPEIHLWDVNTYQNIGVLKGHHKKGVHLLNFFHSDRYLATCGIKQNSPVLIYNLQDFSLILSSYVDGLAIDMFGIRNHIGINDYTQSQYEMFKYLNDTNVILTYSEIYFLTYQNKHFVKKAIKIYSQENNNMIDMDNDENENDFEPRVIINSKIKCGLGYRINTNCIQQCNDQNSVIRVITGHKNGLMVLWEEDKEEKELKYQQILVNYQSEIMNILNTGDMIVIATDQAYCYFWNLDLNHELRKVDLTNCSVKLFNFYICDLLYTETQLLVCTTEGDLIQLELNQIRNLKDNNMDIKAVRNNYITKLTGQLKALSFVEKNPKDRILYIAGENSKVYAFSFESHELIDIWSVGENITSMDSFTFDNGSTHFAVGCQNGKLYMRQDWEEYPNNYEISKQINDIKFKSDGSSLIVVSEDGFAYVFKFYDNSFFNIPPFKIRFNNEVPISISFTDDNLSFIVGTNNTRNIYKIDQSDNKSKNLLLENEQVKCSIWNIYYPYKQKNQYQYIPFIIGGDIKLFVGGDTNGFVYFFRDNEQLQQNCGGFLKGHSSQISRLAMTKNQDLFYSLGFSDQTLIEWKIQNVDEKQKQKSGFVEDNELVVYNEDILYNYDEALFRELNYCGSQTMKEHFKDSLVLFKGTNYQQLNSLINDMEEIQDVKESLTERHKRPPPLSIHLDHIYGFQCYDQRNTLQYIHKYPIYNKKNNVNIPNYMKKTLKKNRNKCIVDLNQKSHQECERDLIYFVGRILIIYNPINKKQKFYEGHKQKITCFSLHPEKVIVASGEVSESPCIHIWNHKNREQLKIIKTNHKNGILKLKFSDDGEQIVSVGMDKYFSIQVTNWKSEDIISVRNQGNEPIFDMQFNPFNNKQLVTCGFQNITFWEIDYRNLLRKQVVRVYDKGQNSNPCIITAIQFLSYNFKYHIQSDLICGNNFGDIGIVSKGQYIGVKELAHQHRMINCLKVVDILDQKVIVVTAGEDEYIRVWDSRFELIKSIYLKKISFLDDVHQSRNISAQSIDFYFCHVQQKEQNNSNENDNKCPIMLVGTRNGDIIEIRMNVEYSLQKQEDSTQSLNIIQYSGLKNYQYAGLSDNQYDQQMERKKKLLENRKIVNFNFECYLEQRYHVNQLKNEIVKSNLNNKKLFITLHPVELIMISVGEDKTMILWDIEKNVNLAQKQLDNVPTCCRFSPDGLLLVIGFIDGQIHFMESKIGRNADNSFKIPVFTIQQVEKGDKNSVINIQFSPNGNKLAVSYDNSKSSKDLFDTKQDKEMSYISIFLNAHKAGQSQNIKQERKVYKKQDIEIRVPSMGETISTNNKEYSKAVYYMTFNNTETHLMIYYQNIDNQLIRLNYDPSGQYIVWDLISNTSVKNWDQIRKIQWQKLNFPNSLIGQYQYRNNDLKYSNQLDDLANQNINPVQNTQLNHGEKENTLKMSAILDLNHYQDNENTFNEKYLILGSTYGDIHMSRFSCLYSENEINNNESMNKQEMHLAKTYSAHSSFVNQLELLRIYNNRKKENKSYLFSTAINDECVMKWKLQVEPVHLDKDYKNYNINENDLFEEVKTYNTFRNEIENILTVRQDIYEIHQKKDTNTQPEQELKLQNIIGRKAFNSRNNLFYDYDERVIYVSGANLVITNFEQKQIENYNEIDNNDQEEYLNQEFITVDSEDKYSSHPEISCINLSQDKKLIAIGTNQIRSKLIIWNICGKSCLKNMIFNEIICITHIRFAFNNRQIAMLAITEDYKQILYLVDSYEEVILAQSQFHYSNVFRYRDIQFFNQSVNKMALCGNRVIQIWDYKGGNLQYYNVKLYSHKQSKDQQNQNINNQSQNKKKEKGKGTLNQSQNQQTGVNQTNALPADQKNEEDEDEDEDKLAWNQKDHLTFMSIILIDDYLIAAGDDGDLYVCDQEEVLTNQQAHPYNYILCLYCNTNSRQFVSGGTDGKVILWELNYDIQQQKIQINKTYEYPIHDDKMTKAVTESNYHIQSLCIGKDHILCGTKSGDIYELQIPKDIEQLNNLILQDVIKPKMKAHDGDHIQAISFQNNDEKIFTITENGLLCVLYMHNLNRYYSYDFKRQTVNMIVSRKTTRIFIAFKDEIVVLRNEINFPLDNNQRLKIQNQIDITDMKLSYQEKILALALGNEKQQNPRIEIYDVEKDEDNFKLMCYIDNLVNSIETIDISTDNYFLMFKDSQQEVVYLNLDNFQKDNSIAIEYDVEWCSDGIKFSDQVRGIEQYYQHDNNSLRVIKISDKTIVVTDEMGTLRLFSYPYESYSQGYMRCYSNHLNFIDHACQSHHGNYLITYSLTDRCMLLWRIQNTRNSENRIVDINEFDN